MRHDNPLIGRAMTGRAVRSCWGAAGLALALALAPACRAQTQPVSGPADLSIAGNARKDTQVLQPKNGETISVRLPKQGMLFIGSLIPWAVTGGKEAHELVVKYDARGIRIQHIGGSEDPPAKVSFTLRLIDGRTITLNVRTGNTKYKDAYVVIT